MAWKKSWSSYGTPSSSQITSDGTGSATASTRSAGRGPASMASRCSSTICWMRGRRAAMRRSVNSPTTARRTGPCSGGSISSIIFGSGDVAG
ncbi:hypothetical protein WBK31_15345 [Nonomuraea sp. N2-4H]|uniref:hypothetical protein n=1 Tax=Nonomuraea sp. N2-4H TaxID=3128898 RepID=UPI003255DBA5